VSTLSRRRQAGVTNDCPQSATRFGIEVLITDLVPALRAPSTDVSPAYRTHSARYMTAVTESPAQGGSNPVDAFWRWSYVGSGNG